MFTLSCNDPKILVAGGMTGLAYVTNVGDVYAIDCAQPNDVRPSSSGSQPPFGSNLIRDFNIQLDGKASVDGFGSACVYATILMHFHAQGGSITPYIPIVSVDGKNWTVVPSPQFPVYGQMVKIG